MTDLSLCQVLVVESRLDFLFCSMCSFIYVFYAIFQQVVEVGALLFISKSLSSASLGFKEQPCHLKNLINSISSSDLSMCIHLEDLYDHFEIKLNDFEVGFFCSLVLSDFLRIIDLFVQKVTLRLV